MVWLIQFNPNRMTYKQTFKQKRSTQKRFQAKQSSSMMVIFCQQLIIIFFLTYQSEYQHQNRSMRVIVWNLPQDSTGIHIQKKGYFHYSKLISTKTLKYLRYIQYQMSSCLVDSDLQHLICLCYIIILSQMLYRRLIPNLKNFVPFTRSKQVTKIP